MPTVDAPSILPVLVLQLLRWVHFLFGILWIGHLYFFNFVQGPFEKSLSPDQKKAVVPQLRGRAIWWFRWGAMVTFASGLLYLVLEGAVFVPEGHAPFQGWLSFAAQGAGPKNVWILFGALLGTIMWFNVWFVIWPRQRVIIASIAGLQPKPENFDALVAAAALASKINTYLSFPMLFGMGARHHLPVAKSLGESLLWCVGVLLVGVGVAVHVLLHVAPKVGREFIPPPPAQSP